MRILANGAFFLGSGGQLEPLGAPAGTSPPKRLISFTKAARIWFLLLGPWQRRYPVKLWLGSALPP